MKKAKTSQTLQQQNTPNKHPVVENPWQALRNYTDARIALGRAGISLPTSEMLAFQLSHAQARDAVNFPLNTAMLSEQLSAFTATVLGLHSQASDRHAYLQRPDLGRKLNSVSRDALIDYMRDSASGEPSKLDIAIVVADGLSALAVQQHALPFISELIAQLKETAVNKQTDAWCLAPITVVEQGRVAIGDEIGELLDAKVVVMLIGERPGLSSPDSLGLYLTWQPKAGLNDASRNCISNIRPAGLSFKEAARRAVYLLNEAKRLNLSGVKLKDRSQDDVIEHSGNTKSIFIE